ncbi:MAG TPA: M1 family aminopeptidase [Pyrinomonadaceae bacterium]|jgi:ABC-type transport system involved in multi-copper enzyme maturation permease subunit
MLRELIRFEWRYHTRQLAFPVGALFFLGMGYVLPVLGYGPGGANLNSPFVVMQSVGLLSLLTIFVLTVFCANAVSRDAEHGMNEIVYATSVGKLRYLTARFAGALAAAAAAFCFAVVGLFAAPMLAGLDADRLGPASPAAYLWALLVLALPNMLLAGAVVFAVAALTRSVLASYVGSVFLYMLYMVVATMIDSPLMAGAIPQSPQAMARAAVLDPFGVSAFFQQTWYWTPAQRNTQLLALGGYFLVNRLLVLGLAAAILSVTYRVFSFRLAAGARPPSAGAEPSPRPSGVRYRPASVAPEGAAGRWAALRAATLLEFRATAASKSFLALLALWFCVAAISVADGPVNHADYRTRLYPTTGTMLEAVETPLAFLATLMLVYFAAEVAWRERIVGADEIVDATPTPSGVFYLAKGGALILLSWLMTLVPILVGAGYQLGVGYTRLEPEVYLSLFYFTGLPLALLAVVVLLVQTLSPNRYVGIVVGMILGLLMLSPNDLGLEHGLVRFGAPPRAPYTEMNGFLAPGVFGLYMVYWGGLAGVLAFVTLGLWRRGRARTLLGRLRGLPSRWGRRGLAGAAACLTVFLCVGGFIFYNTNILTRYETRGQSLDGRAAYERAYRQYETLPQPSVAAVSTTVDLYPSERRFRVAGSYRLENRTGGPLDTVLVSLRWSLRPEQLELAGASLARRDDAFGTYVFALRQPLEPGAAAELRFRINSPTVAVEASGFSYSVVENGSYLTRQAAFPRLGYVAGYELEDAAERRARGLGPPRKGLGLINDPSGDALRDDWLTVDATVSTSDDQVAIGPGDLVREWRQGGRRHFHYRTARPTTPLFGFVSGRYEVRRAQHGGVSVEVYHHPAHAYNVEKMLATAARSLDMFGERFGPYPHGHLRIAELPGHWGFGAFALPGLIVWPEDRGFLTDERRGGEVDLITRRLAHEVSHQWWGHQLYPARVEGGSMLVETLAKYSEMLALEATRGRGSLPRLLRFEREMYLLSRANTPFPEPPLMRVVDLEHVYYSKGAIVMDAMRDLIGEDALNRALRRLLREHGAGGAPATTSQLLESLHAEAAPEHHALIDEWMREVSFLDLRVEAASALALPDGRYRVTATVRGRKTYEPAGGVQPTEVPLDEMIDVAAYAEHPLSTDAAPLYAGKHRLRSGQTEVTFETHARPGFISLDPFERRVEAERADNVRELQVATQP